MKIRTSIRRRDVLKATVATAAAVAFPFPAIAQQRSPNEKLSIAGIGAGGQGGWDIGNCASENIVALCDVDDRRCEDSVKRFPKAKRYRDFRKMFDEMDKQIDAVVVGTPDHTHAPAAAMGMQMGKHCYCEKPLAHTVYEARVLASIAGEKKLATQMGTQIHAGDNYRRVVELVQSGAIGPIGEVHVWLGRFTGRPSRSTAGSPTPPGRPPVPKELDWDLWLGPAPFRPYSLTYVPFQWRYWWAFGNGVLGDFFCHYCDLAFWALKLRHPTTIEAEGPVHPESTAALDHRPLGVPGRGDLPPVKLTWYHGGAHPALGQGEEDPAVGQRRVVCRAEGMLIADYGQHQLCRKRSSPVSSRRATIPDSIGHHAEWIGPARAAARRPATSTTPAP